jgi:hypothetical protein
VQAVRRAVRRRAITRCIELWHTFGERLACDLHKLWGDRVLRARNPDGKDHGFKLKHQQKVSVIPSLALLCQILQSGKRKVVCGGNRERA